MDPRDELIRELRSIIAVKEKEVTNLKDLNRSLLAELDKKNEMLLVQLEEKGRVPAAVPVDVPFKRSPRASNAAQPAAKQNSFRTLKLGKRSAQGTRGTNDVSIPTSQGKKISWQVIVKEDEDGTIRIRFYNRSVRKTVTAGIRFTVLGEHRNVDVATFQPGDGLQLMTNAEFQRRCGERTSVNIEVDVGVSHVK